MIAQGLEPSQVRRAMRVTSDRIKSSEGWPEWVTMLAASPVPTVQSLLGGDHILVTGMNGQVRARAGDFIVQLQRGSLAVCQDYVADDGKKYMRVKA